jgi:hypothetical protein
MVSSRFVWRGLASDITAWSRACLHWQQAKIHHHMRLQPQPVLTPQRRFNHLHIDLVGPSQYSSGFNFIFTVTDCTSKWMEAVPLSDTSAAACAEAYIFSWISRFGVPETITSDRGTQFTSNIWSQLCDMLHISHLQTTAYHPESNGAVERLHCCLKDALHTRTTAATWSEELPFVLLGLCAQPRDDTGLCLRQFLALQLSYSMNFCKETNFLLMQLLKIFLKTLNAPAFSLPRHNSSTQLPAELLRDPFVSLRRCHPASPPAG